MRSPEADQRQITFEDGTRLTYRVVGSGRPILVANGLGALHSGWKPLMLRLGAGYRFLLWDYRGLRADDPPAQGPAAHARDALAILDAERVERAALLGWSIGTQVLLELFAAAPERVAALVLIGGGARAAWGARSEATFPGKLVPRALRLVERVPRRLVGLGRRALRSPEAYAWARRLALVGDQLDDDAFGEVVRDLEEVSLERYLETLVLFAHHDASRVISTIDVPTLVVAAGRDPLTSRAALERIVIGVPGAEYLVLPAATHFAPLDHADHIALRMKKFFCERGYSAYDSTPPPG